MDQPTKVKVNRDSAKDLYGFLVGNSKNSQFNSLFDAAQEFYSDVAEWHEKNSTKKGSIETIASEMFEYVMSKEQQRKNEERLVQQGGLQIMDMKVKENYYKMAQWHLSKIKR